MMDRSPNRSPSLYPPGQHNLLRKGHRRCNCHTVFAYLLSLIASALIVFGVHRYWRNHHEQHWLLLSTLGVLLIFLGSCIYRCGITRLYRHNYGPILRRSPRATSKQPRSSSAGIFAESSQLSLNMLPQCFTNFDTITGGVVMARDANTTTTSTSGAAVTAATSSASASAHRYLSLPLDSLLPPPLQTTASHTAEVHHQMDEQQLMGATTAVSPMLETLVDINVGKRNTSLLTSEEPETTNEQPTSDTPLVQLDLQQPPTATLGHRYHSNESISTTTVNVEDEDEDEEENDASNEPNTAAETLLQLGSTSSEDYSVEEEEEEEDEGEEAASADGSAAPSMINEAPPSYEEVIDCDHSIALVSNYRTL